MMSTSMLSGSPSTQESLKAIQAIAHQAASCKEFKLPSLLLRLYPTVSSSNTTFKDQRKIKEQIWLGDLLHILVEVLQQDFSSTPGGWDTAQQLAFILTSACSGLHPQIKSDGDSEYISEYYEILLPTAVDSTLILASNILQAITDGVCESSDCFQSVTDSLLSLCSSHKSCVQRVMVSPYLLHMMITDHSLLARVMLVALGNLLEIDQNCFLKLPSETLHSILDELVYKMSGSEDNSALLSLNLLASIASVDSSMSFLIVSRYAELLSIVRKWKNHHLEANTKQFVDELESRCALENQTGDQHHAAMVIQASWKGYSARKKMKRVQNGIRRFQQFYRRWKARKEKVRKDELRTKEMHTLKLESTKHDRMSFWENQISLVQQLPSTDVSSFIKQQEIKAATKIQSHWRTHLAQKKFMQFQVTAHLAKSATVIQRAFRDYFQKKKSDSIKTSAFPLRQIEGTEREFLQREIAQFREKHKQKQKSEVKTRQLHDQVQNLLEQFYLSRPVETRKSEQRSIVLSQLERSTSILNSACSLDESFAMDNVIDTFSSSSPNITRMAQIAHKEELKSTDIPWWKRPSMYT